jgi:hypothetical protein
VPLRGYKVKRGKAYRILVEKLLEKSSPLKGDGK